MMSAPSCLPPREVARPKVPPSPNSRDTHAQMFGPADRLTQERILVANPAKLYGF
jgi:hypothetical protein